MHLRRGRGCATSRLKSSRNRQPENLDDFPGNLTPAFLRYRAGEIMKIGLSDQHKLVTTHGGLPVQPIAFVQHDFMAFRRPRDRPARGGEKHIDFLDIRILCYLVSRKNDSWMVSLPEGITENVPLFHASLFGSQRGDDTGFSETLVEAPILGVKLEIPGRSQRNRFDVRNGLENKPFASAKDVNGFAFPRLICQAAEVRLGRAQTVRI
jgi:hypothetical protein